MVIKQQGEQQPEVVSSEAGQSVVEIALTIIILIMVLLLVVDFGRAYFYYLALKNAAEEGAAYGSVYPSWHSPDLGDPNYNCDPNNIEYRVQHESEDVLVDWENTIVTVDVYDDTYPSPDETLNILTVTVEYEYELITPIFDVILGVAGVDSIPLVASEQHVIISEAGDPEDRCFSGTP